jgi:hypothetical protein
VTSLAWHLTVGLASGGVWTVRSTEYSAKGSEEPVTKCSLRTRHGDLGYANGIPLMLATVCNDRQTKFWPKPFGIYFWFARRRNANESGQRS